MTMTRRLAALLGCSALLVAACADNADEPSPETRAETRGNSPVSSPACGVPFLEATGLWHFPISGPTLRDSDTWQSRGERREES